MTGAQKKSFNQNKVDEQEIFSQLKRFSSAPL